MTADLNDTLVFVRVVQDGSFTAAAKALRLPKTTVSRRVRDLEQRLGAQLLHRTTRSLRLTEAGSLYFQHCRGIARSLEDAESAVGQLQSGPRGWLRVTLPYSFGITWISPLIAGFRARYPEVRLELLATHEPLALASSDLDVALRLGAVSDASVVARRLGRFPTGLYASPSYLARYGTPERPEDLLRHRTLTLHQARRDTGYAWPLARGDGPAKSYPVDPVIVASDPEMIQAALREGEGISLAMDASMKADVRARRLRRILADLSGPEQTFHALYPRERVLSPKVRAFVDYLRTALGEMEDR